jgi:hypothetical protein
METTLTCKNCRHKQPNSADPASSLQGIYLCMCGPPAVIVLPSRNGPQMATTYPTISDTFRACGQHAEKLQS